ncbi:hypothetical protein MKW94_018508 [Papaver nudicaule]|uniref:Heme O synthase n=1 Tax=Papaver nudicaule TaxID=74823 RepID=A0AA41S1Q8_PAPNU|nr:hypothetical protein [Papaver nudicaule]
MWKRNSLSLKLLYLSNPSPNFQYPSLFRSAVIFNGNGVRTGVSQTQFYSSSGEFSSYSLNSSKLGLQKSDADRALRFSSSFSAAADVAGPSVSTTTTTTLTKARDVAEVVRHYGHCYLSKARLSMLVVATSGAGFILGSGGAVDIAGLCLTCTGTMVVAASANFLNQVTIKRLQPSGRISLPLAAKYVGSRTRSFDSLSLCRAFVYTPLQKIHPVNTWLELPVMTSLADPSGWKTFWVSLRNCLYLFPSGHLALCKEDVLVEPSVSSHIMSGMLFHRVTENQQMPTVTTPSVFTSETQVQKREDDRHIVMQNRGSYIGIHHLHR